MANEADMPPRALGPHAKIDWSSCLLVMRRIHNQMNREMDHGWDAERWTYLGIHSQPGCEPIIATS